MNNVELLFLNSSAVLNLCGNACIMKRVDKVARLNPGLVEALKHSGQSKYSESLLLQLIHHCNSASR